MVGQKVPAMENDVAKGVGGFNLRNVKQWFSGLDLENQKELLGELNGVFEDVKVGHIERLKAQLAELTGESVAAPTKRAAARRLVKAPEKKQRGVRAGFKVPPKFIDKSTGKTWAGRGVKPAWVEAHLKKGGKLDDLLIAKKRAR